jgi:flavin-dependent thymidylate synthase
MTTNNVELIGYYGGDFTIAQSAWSSTNREMTPDKIDRIPKLLEMLVKGSDGKSHETPYEKSLLHFLVTTDIATHIHILKHRIGVSVNSESARYKELKDDKAYIPDDWPEWWQNRLERHAKQSFALYHQCLNELVDKYGMDKKRAKESARFFNPYATQLTADVSFNFRSLVNFSKLRAVKGAQKEVRDVARRMIVLVSEIEGNPFQHSLNAWGLLNYLTDK